MRRAYLASIACLIASQALAHNGSIHTHDLVAAESQAQGLQPSNPVMTRLEGLRTFDIGPGWPDTFESVPWGTLRAGDVVNIHWRETPYLAKFGLRAIGTADAPVVINGVTDSLGNRPVIQFRGARTAPGSREVFNASQPQYNEGLGGIVIKRAPGEYTTPKPSHIWIRNLELRDTTGSFTTLNGATRSFGTAACVYVLASADLVLDNLIVTGCQFGIFTMAKDGLLSQTSERPVIRNSRVYGNGKANSWFEHNLYVQAALPVVEGNFIGKVRSGSLGSSFKDRSAGLIFRNNYVQCSERCFDGVHSEDQDTDGIVTLPEYGKDYVYGNIFDNASAYAPLHYGGDNWCEQEDGSAECVPPVEYRSQLFFWGNRVIQRAPGWRVITFDLSLRDTTVEAWNNVFEYGPEAENHFFVEYAGTVRLGTNVFSGPVQMTGRDGSNPDMITIEASQAIVPGGGCIDTGRCFQSSETDEGGVVIPESKRGGAKTNEGSVVVERP